MQYNVVTPSVGESITEVSILKWTKQSGQAVKAGEVLLEIESDKATVEVAAEYAGVIQIAKAAGEKVKVGETIATIDTDAQPSVAAGAAAAAAAPAPGILIRSPEAAAPAMSAAPAVAGATPGPAARKLAEEKGLNPATMSGTGKDGRLTKGDILTQGAGAMAAAAPTTVKPPAAYAPPPAPTAPRPTQTDHPGDRRVPMTNLRARIAERLVQAQHTAAILTTFNEVDMTAVMELRAKHKEAFRAKNGVALSYMSFFTMAAIESLKLIPEVNASIDGRDIIYHDYYDIGIAVGSDRGLVVPVVRDAGNLSMIQIEKKIAELAVKAKDSKLSIADLSGGTFTISNGGTYGSLMSTPILNPPQSGILGMHKIQERPMAVNGKVEIRPMMYLALSYDHRIIDGKGAVTFLVQLKDFLEHPEKLKLEL